MTPQHRRTAKTTRTTPTFQTSLLIPFRPCPPSLTCHVPPRLPWVRTRAYPQVTRCGIQRPERYDATDWAKALSTLPHSIVLRRVRGHIIANSVASSLVLVAYEFFLRNAPDFVHHLNVTPIPHTFMVNAMSLLLVFRSNAAYVSCWQAGTVFLISSSNDPAANIRYVYLSAFVISPLRNACLDTLSLPASDRRTDFGRAANCGAT